MTVETSRPSVEQQMLIELKKISKIITLTNGEKLEKEIGKYANTDERKKAWVLIDGKNDVEEFIKLSGLKRRSVYDFLAALEKAGFIERERGKPPVRMIDYVPSDWISLTQLQTSSIIEQAISPQDSTKTETTGVGQNG